MDRGRMIDHTQNVNARNFDNFAKGKTSIKLFHPPGGEDHLQLGWDYDEPEDLNIKNKNQPKKPVYEPAFVMPKKEYTKSYHVIKKGINSVLNFLGGIDGKSLEIFRMEIICCFGSREIKP